MRHLLWAFVSVSLWAQPAASPGSLYTPGGRLADSTRDLRAGEVNDIVSDRASAVSTGTTNTSRKSSASNSIKSLAGPRAATGPLANLLSLNNDQQLQGQGQTTRDMTLTTTISARVTSVMPNGTLVVEGTKNIAVNSEKQAIFLHGLIRPADLTPANTVRSDQVADLRFA